MRRDPTEFRQRFAAWKDGENYWDTRGEDMLPGYSGGKTKKDSAYVSPQAQQAVRYFMSKGLTDFLAAGLVGNLMRESGMNHRSKNSGSGAYGLAQWLGSRKKALFNKYGNNPSFQNQLDFIWHELNTSHKSGLKYIRRSKTAEEAARNAMGYYEFSAGPEGAIAEMNKYGQDGRKSMREGITNATRLIGLPIPSRGPLKPTLISTQPVVERLKENELPLQLPNQQPIVLMEPLPANTLLLTLNILAQNDYWDGFFNNSSLDLLQSLMQQLMTSHKHGKNILPRHKDGKTPGEYNEELVELPEVRVDDEGNVVNNGRRGSVRLPEVVVKPDHNVREAVDRYYDKLSRRSERAWYTNPITGESYMPKGGPLESVYPEFDLITLGQMSAPILKTAGKRLINSVGDNLSTRGWTYRIPQDENMAYRIIGPLERDWILEGNELSTRATNSLTKAEEIAARNKSGRFNLFKAGAEHGGRKQFAKGQPWLGTTTTHGEPQYLAIPGKDLNWVSGRHYRGPEGYGFSVGDINFENAPFGSHIDLLTNESGFTGVNPSLMDGSVIYSPYKIFGRNFGYKKLHPTIPQITTENAINATPAQWTAAQDAAIARGDMAEAQRLRDLHFKVSAPDTKVDIPLWSSSEEPFNSFDLSHFGETDNGFFGYGHYLTPIEKYAATYHPVNRKFYVNIKNPYTGGNDQYFNRVQYVKDRLARRKENVIRNLRDGKLTKLSKKLGINESTSLEDAEHLVDKYIADETVKWNDRYVKYVDEFEGKDGVLSWRDIQGIPNKREGIYKEVVVPRGEQIKSADAVTFDDKGIRIPLGERDNFNINDIRYGIVPFLGIGSAAYGLNEYKHGKSPIHINPANRGKFNALKKRTGKTTELLTHSKNPLTRKRAIFAQNAAKWRRK